MSSEYDGLYVYVLRTEDMVLGVFAEMTTALEFKENFIAIYPRISPNCVKTTFYLDRRLVIGVAECEPVAEGEPAERRNP